MTAADLLPIEDDATILEVSGLAKVRPEAVRRVLRGEEVWARTYRAVRDEYAAKGVDVPPMAERAPRRPPASPCPACAAKDHEFARVKRDLSGALDECERLRARLAVALADEPRSGGPPPILMGPDGAWVAPPGRNVIVTGLGDDKPRPAAGAPAATLDPPAETEPTVETVSPGVTVVHGVHSVFSEPPRPAPRPREGCKVRVLMPGEELLPDGTVTTPAAAAG